VRAPIHARALPWLALSLIAFAYGCGANAPNDLFSSTHLGASSSSAFGGGGSSAFGNAGASVGPTTGGSNSSETGGVNAGGSVSMQLGGAAGSGGSSLAGSGGAAGTGAASDGGSSPGGAPSSVAGSAGAGGSVGKPPSACDGRLVAPPALVTDFEQGVAGWLGYMDSNPAPVVSIEPGAHGTEHAANFSGGAAKISGMYFQIPCRDVSDFSGITFWGKSNGSGRVRFLAVIPATDPTADIGDCDPAEEVCSDHPGKPFTFTPQWTQYYAAWSDLKQLGFGAKASFGGVINALLWINDGPVDHFDFSIDEVSFYPENPG